MALPAMGWGTKDSEQALALSGVSDGICA